MYVICLTCNASVNFFFAHICRLPELQGKSFNVADAELSVRKLFRMAVHIDYFARLSRHPRTVNVMTQLLGPDVKLLQSMALLKPPGMLR